MPSWRYFLIIGLDKAEYAFHKVVVFFIVADGNTQKFSGFHHAIHSYGEVLPVHDDVRSVEQWQHAFRLEVT